MVLHELTTDAAKYGAFSDRNGRVSIRWRWLRNGSTGRLAIEWREIGGPQVQPPSQSGYGTAAIGELIPFELGGTAELTFPSDGVRCRMEIPAEWVGSAAGADKEANESPSRPRDFHPEPLTDPDLSLSTHPARAIARRLPPSTEQRAPPGEPVGPNQRR